MIDAFLRLLCMDTLLLFFYNHLDRFERWFDHRFGWFFTNGMKDREVRRPHSFKV